MLKRIGFEKTLADFRIFFERVCLRDKANLTRYSREYVLLGEQNRWLQTAAKNLIKNKRSPADPEIVELARLCMMESKKADDPRVWRRGAR